MNKETVIAKHKNHLFSLVNEEIRKNGYSCDLNFIDTSLITDMSELFWDSDFNGDISNWNTSNVEDMTEMFEKTFFNQNISNWNVSKVTNMNFMFENSNFNQDISNWHVVSLNGIMNMFENSLCKTIPYWAKNIENLEHYKKILKENDYLKNNIINTNVDLIKKTNKI